MNDPTLHEFKNRDELFDAAADAVLAAGRKAVEERQVFHLVLSGGSTPKGLYARLREREDFDWSRAHFWWGDERCVPPDHDDSNFKMAWESWLASLAPDRTRVHRMRGELGAEAGAEDYAAELREWFDDELPVFDLVLLGLGEDGHTASLFPGRPEAIDHELLVTPARAPSASRQRISLGLKALLAARRRLFLIAGSGKRPALEAMLRPGSSRAAALVARQPGSELFFAHTT